MSDENLDFTVPRLGPCTIVSPMAGVEFVPDDASVLYHDRLPEIMPYLTRGHRVPQLELAGPREKIYFDPTRLKCGIVTCGGLCPGLNDVVRAIVLSLYHHYGVRVIYGFRYGYEGLSPRYDHEPMELTPEIVTDIHQDGGTILGSSRGPQDIGEMVDNLVEMGIGVLFTVGGDGTLRGASAIVEEIGRRALDIAVVGVPKTIDNDISYVQASFGFETAVGETRSAIYSAHAEATGARNGIGLVKLMGRESGFIAAFATLANSEVNFCLVPEARFSLEGFLAALKRRIEMRHHAVIVVGEGAGQYLMEAQSGRDASGNVRFGDIGLFLKERIVAYFKQCGIVASLKYIDPSYIIRSMPANPKDSAFCLVMGHSAVHAAMSGRTNVLVGYWKNEFTHVPISLATSRRKKINPHGRLWSAVLESTGQPREM